MMLGCDPDALDALADQLLRHRDRVTFDVADLEQLITTVPWNGADADELRSSWRTTAEARANQYEDGLQRLATLLRRNADEQRRASGADGAGASGGSTVWDSILEALAGGPGGLRLRDVLGLAQDLTSYLISPLLSQLEGRMVHVGGYIRANGTMVDDYYRWSAGQSDDLTKWFGKAGIVKKLAKGFEVAGFVLDAGTGFWDEWSAGAGLPTDERTGRAVAAGVFDGATGLAAGAAGAYIGGAVGSLIPIPVVGTVVGAAVGAGIGWAASEGIDWITEHTGVDEWVADIGGEIGDAVGDGVEAVADFAGDVGGVVSDGWNAMTGWLS